MKKRNLLWPSLVLCTIALLTGCMFMRKNTDPHTAGALREGETCYLPEGEAMIPYDVVSSDYSGGVLLLRQNILPVRTAYGEDDTGYYGESIPDRYLNTEFFACFPEKMQEVIRSTPIVICRKFPDSGETETITRRIFLLSASETGIDMEMLTKEGKKLSFFEDAARCLAEEASDGPAPWWLRSAYTADRGLAWQIAANGTCGGAPVWMESGLRPALCVDPELHIVYRDDLSGYIPDFTT